MARAADDWRSLVSTTAPHPRLHSRRSALRLAVATPLALLGCKDSLLTFEYVGGALSRAERRVIEAHAETAVSEVRGRLPGLPRHLRVTVATGTDVIPETGETATAYPPDTVAWVVDPSHEGGVGATARAQLRATLHHELHHLVRDQAIRRATLIDHVVSVRMQRRRPEGRGFLRSSARPS